MLAAVKARRAVDQTHVKIVRHRLAEIAHRPQGDALLDGLDVDLTEREVARHAAEPRAEPLHRYVRLTDAPGQKVGDGRAVGARAEKVGQIVLWVSVDAKHTFPAVPQLGGQG